MWITKEELKTHMNVDNIGVITGSDDTLVAAAIDGAVSEAKSYLGSYNANTIFATTGTARHDLLLIFVKDIAVWHLMALSNYQADVATREKRYNAAKTWLKGVQKGEITPDLPVSTEDYHGNIAWGSNIKRVQHF